MTKKKRRDNEHDSSTVKKVAKVAALAVGVGAAYFNNPAIRKKLVTETLPSIAKTSKAVSKELRDSKALRKGLDKRTTGKDLQKAFKTGKKTFIEQSKKLRDNPLRINSTRKNNLFGAIKHVEQIKAKDVLYGLKNNTHKGELQADAIYRLISKYSNKDANAVRHLATEAFANIEENTLTTMDGNIGFSDFLSKHFRKASFSVAEEKDFLKSIYVTNEIIKDRVRNGNKFIKEAKDKVYEELDKTILESKKRSDTLFGKFDKFIKDKFNVDIDSEMLLSSSRPMTVKDLKALIDDEKVFNQKDLTFQVVGIDGKRKLKSYKNYIDKLDDLADDIIVDKSMRIGIDGDIYSTAEAREVVDNLFRDFSSSTLGKIFGLTDVRLNNDKAIFTTFKALSTGKEAAYELGNKAGDTILKHSKIAIANPTTGKAKLFEVTLDEDGYLSMSDAIAEGKLRNNLHGKSARLNKEIVGTNKELLEINESE